MTCRYCSNPDAYDVLPHERVITNVQGLWDKDQHGPKPTMGHKSKHPIAAIPEWFVHCEEPER